MALHVALTHRSSYQYDRTVRLGPQTIRLRPAPQARTPIISYALKVLPAEHFLNWQQDPQGNHLARVVFPERLREFSVQVDLVADLSPINAFDFFLDPEAERFPFAYDPVLESELAPFRQKLPGGAGFAALLATMPREAERTIDLLVEVNRRVQERIAYIVRMEPGVWAPDKTLGEGRGSCRDSAWLLVQLLRHMGLAARFVSGYLIQLVADVVPLEGPAGPSADFTDLHAWAEVYLPGAGWIGLDATSGLLTAEGHIPLAASPEPISAAPITGLVDESEVSFDVQMSVRRVRETPRVTRPYSDRQWQDILAAGEAVDARLRRQNVRLTMGGEPTFVAATDQEAGEWSIDALGPTKRVYAGRLLRRLAERWAPGAALVYGMGKQYPGEPLPRWALSAHWRADGAPVWLDPGLLASDDDVDDATAEDALGFGARLAERLQLDPGLVLPAFEDVHYYLWREKLLPANVVAEAPRLADPLERARLARLYGGGLGRPAGAVLPLRRAAGDGARRWRSGPWFFRGGSLFLLPGDSPIGYRLPLESLPWVDPELIASEAELPPDPFAPRAVLPAWEGLRVAAGAPARVVRALPGMARVAEAGDRADGPGWPGAQDVPPISDAEAAEVVRTALAVEAREGRLHVFFPPLTTAEDWLELVAAVEQTAQELGRKVVLEGYLPPRDPRLPHFSVTPDPGVIEVNVHPVESWAEQVGRTTELYEAARAEGLAAEKFMLDGRHVGTGGGNHVVMGAASPADSPFLRRPDLLKSLLGFWHNHPGLSYLFSGLFIGPTSQHPRVDEARGDAVAELELAFAQVRPGEEMAPWVVDRVFRNILVDMTGNAHRTEFCIDKLYTPAGGAGRLGLVEYRGAEMPPDARMSLAQSLLMRAAVAGFWEQPYARRLVRWGTRLHDDFMLPWFVAQDLGDALEELAARGLRIDAQWFAPHLAFRFPLIGEVHLRGVGIELRHALEPWHVLGEEVTGVGTARYVDSSVERLQVRVSGHVPERYVLACNGAAVPLTPTGVAGEFVGGVRFKAWAPPSALHPTVPARPELVFDLFDSWNGRAIGGMTYHVVHPGGLGSEVFPVNAGEAESRRRSRFWTFGHGVGEMAPPVVVCSDEHPRTLDLRRAFAPD